MWVYYIVWIGGDDYGDNGGDVFYLGMVWKCVYCEV